MNVKSLLGRGDAPGRGKGPTPPGSTGGGSARRRAGGTALPAVLAAVSIPGFRFLLLIIIFILFFYYPNTRRGIKKGQRRPGWPGVSQVGGGSFGLPAGAKERVKAEPLLYSFSHRCSEPIGHGVTSGAWVRKLRLWLGVGFSTGFSHGGGWFKGNELCRSPCPPSQHSPKCPSSWCLELIRHIHPPPATFLHPKGFPRRGFALGTVAKPQLLAAAPRRQVQAVVQASGLGA